jgi:hypothetical protein
MTTAERRVFPTVAVLGLLSACSGGDATGSGGDDGGSGGTGGTGGGISSLDTSSISFVDNLLVKVEDGEWTLGEGLVATLKLLAGEIDASSVLRHPELLDYEGTGIIAMASNEQLEAMAGLDPETPARPGSQPDIIQPKDSMEDCGKFFHGEVIPGVGECLEHLTSSALDDFYPGAYRIFYPAASFPAAGWTKERYNLALQALEESVLAFKGLGQLPPVNMVFSAKDNPPAWAQAVPRVGKPCGVALYTALQQVHEGDFKQILAHELAHCFQTETFPEQNQVDYEFIMWREEGLANYLSNLVYRDNNLEWGKYPERRALLDLLELYELASTLLERSYTNLYAIGLPQRCRGRGDHTRRDRVGHVQRIPQVRAAIGRQRPAVREWDHGDFESRGVRWRLGRKPS